MIKGNNNNNVNTKIVNIIVEEKPTGEIFAGVGTGTAGTTFTAGIKENNYLGKGIILDTDFTISHEEIKGKFRVINPNYKNTDKSLNTTIESTNADYMLTSGYKTSRTGFNIGTGLESIIFHSLGAKTLRVLMDLIQSQMRLTQSHHLLLILGLHWLLEPFQHYLILVN